MVVRPRDTSLGLFLLRRSPEDSPHRRYAMTTGNEDLLIPDALRDDVRPDEQTSKEAPSEKQAKQEEVNWKDRFEESESARRKVENDLKAEQGRRRQAQSFQDLQEDMGGVKALLTAIANRTASGETEALAQDVATITEQARQMAGTRTWEANYSEAERNLGEVLLDENNKVVISENDVSVLAPLWQDARARQDLHGLYRVVSQASRLVRATERAKAQVAVKETEAAAQARKKASDAKAGIHDLSIGSPAGGLSPNLTPEERIAKGIREHREGIKKSPVFG